MGKAKTWTVDEHAALAQAWVNASEDAGGAKVHGTNQDSDQFYAKVIANFKDLAPKDQDIRGLYHNREASAIVNHWKNNIAREVKKFNKALLRVLASNPTGVGNIEKINMATAIHLGKVDAVSHRHIEFPASEWKFYRAWMVLKDHKMFAPPKPKEPVAIEDNSEAEDASEETSTDDTEAATGCKTPVALFASANKSRGPGPGRAKTKAQALDNDYKAKKAKAMTDLVQLQKDRASNFAMFVSNDGRAKAFQMAALGFSTFKDSDPELAEQYKTHMSNILAFDKNEEAMPPLAGAGEDTSAGTNV